MIKSKSATKGKRYPLEFRRQIVALVRAGRNTGELAREFGCTVWTIHRWVHQADRDAGQGDGGLTTAERAELSLLRREVRELRTDREILSKAAAWFAQERGTNAKRSSPL
jgi:transposase